MMLSLAAQRVHEVSNVTLLSFDFPVRKTNKGSWRATSRSAPDGAWRQGASSRAP